MNNIFTSSDDAAREKWKSNPPIDLTEDAYTSKLTAMHGGESPKWEDVLALMIESAKDGDCLIVNSEAHKAMAVHILPRARPGENITVMTV